MTKRPAFQVMWKKFIEIYGDGTVIAVGKKIGGRVNDNIELGVTNPKDGFTNGCAIRLSYSLNYSGFKVGRGVWKTVSGADKLWYMYRVRDLRTYLRKHFGKPDKSVTNPKPENFANMKGIIAFEVNGWSDASGHATMWNGKTCSDHCYFAEASEASLWVLK